MNKREELDLFLLRADELIDSKYILASKKIENLLKSIANSETLLSIFKNCLKDLILNDETLKTAKTFKMDVKNKLEESWNEKFVSDRIYGMW